MECNSIFYLILKPLIIMKLQQRNMGICDYQQRSTWESIILQMFSLSFTLYKNTNSNIINLRDLLGLGNL